MANENGVVVLVGNQWKIRSDAGAVRRIGRVQPNGLDAGDRVTFRYSGGQVRDLRAEGSNLGAGRDAAPRHTNVNAFLNPYAFVPLGDRTKLDGDLADREPVGHHRLAPGHWTGRLRVVMRTETPLLAFAAQPEGTDHKVFSVDEYVDGRPRVAATGVKGMLRSAYEAVTMSRFGVYPTGNGDDERGHSRRLAYRMTTQDGLKLVPGRVSDTGDEIELLGGTTEIGRQGQSDQLLHAAWVPSYGHQRVDDRFNLLGRAHHGQPLAAALSRVTHRSGRFRYWQVAAVAPTVDDLPATHTLTTVGWLCITERNIGNKHDERFFFTDGTAETSTRGLLTDTLRSGWADVIRSYRDAHTPDEIWKRRGADGEPWRYIGREPGKTAWSRHLWSPKDDADAERLSPGQLVYARLEGRQVVGLYPVTIGRELFDVSPNQLLAPHYRPATKYAELSPADRVFGWVSPHSRGNNGVTAYRGQLRVGPVETDAVSEQALTRFDPPLPLAILGQPKPAQARFYVGGRGGAPLPSSLLKSGFYKDNQSLRGRKFYVHHAGPGGNHWEATGDRDTTQQQVNGRYREFLRAGKEVDDGGRSRLNRDGSAFDTQGRPQQDTQNRSIRGWVNPGIEFSFDIEVTNLSDGELGALLWLLQLNGSGRSDQPSRFHRVGYGKPLGFGSVALWADLDRSALVRTEAWLAYYRDLSAGRVPDAALDQNEAVRLAGEFEQRIRRVSPEVLDAFVKVSEGDPQYPVHYPRVRPAGLRPDVPVPPDPAGRAYEWFVANERTTRQRDRVVPDHGAALPPAGEPLEAYDATPPMRRPPRR